MTFVIQLKILNWLCIVWIVCVFYKLLNGDVFTITVKKRGPFLVERSY